MVGMQIDIIHNEDCLEGMGKLPNNSIDQIATDPPYGIKFMSKSWDKALPDIKIWRECLRVLKPGALAFVMCIPRQDCLARMIISLEDAGFNVSFTSDYWAYASGFPKAQNIGKAVDKRLGAEREILGKSRHWSKGRHPSHQNNTVEFIPNNHIRNITKPATPQAQALDGSYGGFQPKPAVEVVIVAMKPLSEKTYVDQALANRHGISWLDEGRVPYEGKQPTGSGNPTKGNVPIGSYDGIPNITSAQGRFPANLLVSDDALNDGRNISSKGHFPKEIKQARQFRSNQIQEEQWLNDSGSFSRYFSLDAWWEKRIKQEGDIIPNESLEGLGVIQCNSCNGKGKERIVNPEATDWDNYWIHTDKICPACEGVGKLYFRNEMRLKVSELPAGVRKTFPFLIVPKASKSEKNRGCEGLEKQEKPLMGEFKENPGRKTPKSSPTKRANFHPTVKPLKLMSYLITLGSRKGDVILDPFIGSGTTAIAARMLGRHYVGYETDREYVKIANSRLAEIQLALI